MVFTPIAVEKGIIMKKIILLIKRFVKAAFYAFIFAMIAWYSYSHFINNKNVTFPPEKPIPKVTTSQNTTLNHERDTPPKPAKKLKYLPRSDRLIVGISESPLNINPFMPERYVEKVITDLVYAPLVCIKKPSGIPQEAFENVLISNITANKNQEGIMNLMLHDHIPLHGSSKQLEISDIQYTVDSIQHIKNNPYQKNNISIYSQEPNNNIIRIKVGYPLVGIDKQESLQQYLTFPIVPKNTLRSIHQIVSTNYDIQQQISGAGPYQFENYDQSSNIISLKRFKNYLSQKKSIPQPVLRIEFHYRDIHETIIKSFKEGRMHIVLDYFGKPIDEPKNLVLKLDPFLNSFTCLAFNFRQNDFLKLFQSSYFRDTVAACMNEKVRRTFHKKYPGKSMYVIDELHNRYLQNHIYRHDRKIDNNTIPERAERIFSDVRLKQFKYKTIYIHYEGCKPEAYVSLAQSIQESLNRGFRGYLEFKVIPTSTAREWNSLTVHQRSFHMILFTYCFGVNGKILNPLFFSENDHFNLTGKRIQIRYKHGELDYDNFLLKINKELPVIMLGSFMRYNLFNSQELITPWNDPQREDRSALINSPLFYRAWEWQWK